MHSNVIVKAMLLLLHWEANIFEPSVSTASIWRKDGVACEKAPSSMYHGYSQKYSSKSHQLLVSLSPTTHSGTSYDTMNRLIVWQKQFLQQLNMQQH